MPRSSPDTRAVGARWNHVGGKDGAVGAALISELVNRARRAPELGDLSTNRLSRLVRAYVAADACERDLVSWVISYRDEAGETAVRNVMREARS